MPDILWKYAKSARYFNGGMIRFSQPGALNDPDEARPALLIGRYSKEDYEYGRWRAARQGMSLTLENIERFFLRDGPRRRYDEKTFPGLWPMRDQRLKLEPIRSLEEFDHLLAERAIQLCRSVCDQHIGILSLSSSRSESMWALYADDHKGVAIGFKGTHPWLQLARPISYSDEPIYVSSNDGVVRIGGVKMSADLILHFSAAATDFPHELLFRKKKSWAFEQEWRRLEILSPTVPPRTACDDNGFPIRLSPLPTDMIEVVVAGYRASDTTVQEIVSTIDQQPELKHVRVCRRIDASTRIVEQRVR